MAVPTGWSSTVAGAGWTVDRSTSVVRTGAGSLVLASAGSASGSAEGYRAVTLVAGKMYRAAGYYFVSGNTSTVSLMVLAGSAGAWLVPNGRDVSATGDALLGIAQVGEWRRFCYDFIAPVASATIKLRLEASSAVVVQAYFDEVELRRIYRYNYYAPRINSTVLPESDASSNDVFFGGKPIGVGGLAISNSDGAYDIALGELEWINSEFRVYFGGKFLDGQALTLDDYRQGFTGLVQNFESDDSMARMTFEDARTFFHTRLPPTIYSDIDFPNLDQRFLGKSRPVWFGAKENITPIGVEIDPTTLLRTYELCDTTNAPNGIKIVTAVYAYTDDTAAGLLDPAKRIALVEGTDYTVDLVHGQISLIKDPGPYVISTDKSKLDFSTGGAPLVATLTPGLYTSAALAAHIQASLRKVVGGGDTTMQCTYSNTTGKFTISRSSGTVGVLFSTGTNKALCPWKEIGFSNDFVYLDFDIGGAALAAKLSPSAQDGTAQAAAIQSALRDAVGGGDTTMQCAWSASKFTISRSSGTLNLRVGTGVNNALTAYPAIGFNGSVDKTGAGSYLADVVSIVEPTTNIVRLGDRTGLGSYAGDASVMVDPDTQHIIRVNGSGYKDDGAGTYTGTIDALIETGSDICRTLLMRWLGRPASRIDNVSFAFSRTRAPESLALYIKDETTTKTVFETLELSNIANVTIDGAGKVYYEVYVGDTPTTVVDLVDSDFLAFKSAKSVADVYTSIRVQHDQDPTTSEFEARDFTDTSVAVLYGRPDLKTFDTYIKFGDNALAAAARMGALANAPARQVAAIVRGKLVDHRVGMKVRVTRNRAADPNGSLNSKLFRIIALKHSHQKMETSVSLVDDVVTVAGYSCISECQSACEASCQQSCEVQCQATCESLCQEACESSCQEACQSSCQVECQASCESGCQAGCQAACQLGCQAACQVSCQEACESACQTGCQATCEDTCQTLCMVDCEVACKTICMGTCQVISESLWGG